ncbi:hypothetical protein pipiens_005792 [Culex pipiens pipiens]|uniref:Uncharacterized protein n=1 Tax=Culex pipiens pipiens TaxID=38569 RepID=A0ABD1DU54_CULPP
MKFVLVLAALVAFAVAAPSTGSSGTLDLDKLQVALVDVGVAPEEAHGFVDFLKGAGKFVLNNVISTTTTTFFKMKFVLVLAALVAVAVAAPSTGSSGTLDLDKLQVALVDVGVAPEEAHGFVDFLKGAGKFVLNNVVPIAIKVLPAVIGAVGK